jgi:hypothetical protein
MSRRHKWNALADEHRNDMDVELVDLASVQERGDKPRSTHHPDLFARSGPQTLREYLHRLRYELHTCRGSFGRVP